MLVGRGISSVSSSSPTAATIICRQRHEQQSTRQWYSNVSTTSCSSRFTSSLVSSAFQPTNDDDSDNNYDYNHAQEKESLSSSSFTMDHHHRPRLQALREQLRNERNNLPTPPNTLQQHARPVVYQHRHEAAIVAPIKRKIPSQDPSSPSPLSSPSSVLPSLDNWNVFLSQLPDPPSWDAVLTDRFHRSHNYVRLSLTERCNFRCTYCMPPEGVADLAPKSHLLQSHEIVHLAQLLAHAGGVTKFRLTGGEPTIRKDLVDIVAGLHAIELPTWSLSSSPQHPQIGMTTNGLTLSKVLPDLVQAGLSSVNISLDTLKADQFAQITRRPASYFDAVWQSLQDACALSHQMRESEQDRQLSVKLNCVVMRGINDHEVTDFLHLAKDAFPQALLQVRFIEYMPFTKNGWNTERFVSYQELLSQIAASSDGSSSNLQLVALPPHDPHDTTKWYTFADQSSSLQHQPRIGFITSMSNDFCAGCNRLRLSADGQIKVCLFQSHDDDHANKNHINVLNLRDALRAGVNEQGLLKLVWNALQTKHARLGGHENAQDIQRDADHNRPMTVIGG